MILGKFFKAPAERKRYSIDYGDWLDTGENVSGVTFAVTPADEGPVLIDGDSITPDAKGVVFFASAGLDGKQYKAIVTMTTSAGQTKEDSVQYTVKAS